MSLSAFLLFLAVLLTIIIVGAVAMAVYVIRVMNRECAADRAKFDEMADEHRGRMKKFRKSLDS